jgi:hypothetical protein
LGFKFSVEFYGIKEAGIKGDELNVAFVALDFSLPAFANEKRFSGCRSWIGLPPRPEMKMRPVLDDVAQAELRAQFERLVSSS